MPNPEAKAANRILLLALLLAASYTLMRTVGDSLFLSRIGTDSLAAVFVLSGITTATIASLWFALTRRFSLAISIRVSGLLFAAITIAAWFALPQLHHSWWLLAGIYLLTEIKGCVYAINIVTATNELLGGHSSRQAWARIGLGAPLAGIIFGSLIGMEASFVDLRSWLLFSALLDLLAIFPLANSASLKVPRPVSTVANPNSMAATMTRLSNSVKNYACSRQFRFWIGCLIAAKVVVLTMVTFYWKATVNDYFGGDELALTRYFGIFYACVGLLTLLVQGFVTGRLITRRSLYVPILAMPVTLIILGALVLSSSAVLFLLIIVTMAKSLEIWRRSVHDTTLNLLYTKIERNKRRSAIAINSALVKPLAEVGASLVLLLGSVVWHQSFLMFGLGVWILATISLLRLVAQTQRKSEAADHSVTRDPANSKLEQFVPGLFDH